MMFIVRAEFQSLKYLRHHPAVMAFVGIPDHRAKRGPVGWTRGLRFLDQIAQGLLADDWKDNIAHDPIRFPQSRAGDFEQQVLFARDALQIVEQFAVNPVLGTCADVVDGFDEQIDEVIGQCPAAQMHEGREPGKPGRLRMPAEFVRGLGRDTTPTPFELMGEHAIKQTGRQLDLANQLQLGQFVLDARQPRLAWIAAQPQKQRGVWLRMRIGCRIVGPVPGGTQQRFQTLSCPCGKAAQDAVTETIIMSVDRGTDDPIDTIRCGRLDRKLAAPRLKERGELVRNRPDCRHSISQPGFEQFGVGDGRFPEAQQGSDLGAVPFRGSPWQVQRKVSGHLNDELPCDLLDDRSIDIGGGARKSAAVTEECQQHGKGEPVGMMLGHDERPVRRRHDPSFGSFRSIEHFHFG